MENLRRQYNDNVQKFKADFADCSDFLLKEAETGGRKCFFAVMDGLVDSLQLGQMIMGPVLGAQVEARTPGEQFRQLMRTCVQSVELKEAETFEDAYYYLMSGFCLFEMMNVKIVKDIRNSANRKANCETANIERMVQAVRVQLDAIEKIRRLRGLEYLSEDLHAMARLREENPDSSLSELAEMSALSRSGVNHRLRRIVDIAAALDENV